MGGGRFVLKLRDGQDAKDLPENAIFTWEKAVMMLSNPWDIVTHYKNEQGEHYNCIIYDFVWIDIWADTVQELFNLIARLIHPDSKGIDLLENISKEKIKSPLK